MQSESCGTCGATLAGRFCHQCGEPATHHGDLALRHLAHDFLHEFTHVDGKILRTLLALLFAPGKLTAEYWKGRRGMWVMPLRLYLVITALQMLLAANASGPLGLRVWTHGEHIFVGANPPVTFGKTLVLFMAVGLTETVVLAGAVLLAMQGHTH